MTLGIPTVEDGPQLWHITRDSGALDLNSPYSYLLWCRDFASTSVAARIPPPGGPGSGHHGRVVGFVTGYVRPQAPDTVLIWQVAVEAGQRGRGLAAAMLHHLADRLEPAGVSFLEATVTPGNQPSDRLFSAFARDAGAAVERRVLFSDALFPQPHEPEVLFRIGPLPPRPPGGAPGAGHSPQPRPSRPGS